MGIRNIFPVAKTLAPQSISAPFPVSALKGLRVAIDATLVTQRLHFADDPHPSRHLIGFYRLIRSLRQVGVHPIMVFDHPYKRLALKEREQEKRREKRKLDLIRSKLETERRQRLQKLGLFLKEIQTISLDERKEAGAMLQRWNASKTSESPAYTFDDVDAQTILSENYSPVEQDTWWSDLREVMQSDARSLQPFVEDLEVEPPVEEDVTPAMTPDEEWIETVSVQADSLSRPHVIAYNISTLQSQLQASYQRLGSNHSQTQKKLAEGESRVYEHIFQSLLDLQKPTTLSDQADRAMVQALDSLQVDAKQLESATTDELVKPEAPPTPEAEPLSSSLSSLEKINSSLSRTYDRGTMQLSASVYRDCAELASLMAVPVFWTGDGTRWGGGRIHEAEAYAASLVQAGYADLVASEDSDVLLYDAVLLRGLLGGVSVGKTKAGGSDRDKRVEIVGSTRLRQGLFPYEDLEALHARLTAQKQARLAAQAEEREQKRLRSRNASTTPEPVEVPSSLAPFSPEEYDRMSREMMLEYSLLCGTDFNQTVPSVGPKTAHTLLKQYGSISAFLEDASNKYKPPGNLSIKEYEAKLRDARSVFTNPPAVKAAARSVFKATGPSAPAFVPSATEEQLFDRAATHQEAETDAAETDTAPQTVEMNEDAALAFLESRGVWRFSLNRSNEQEWRDETDSDQDPARDSSDAAAINMVTNDYFGSARGSKVTVASWKPTADVKRDLHA